MKVLVGNIKGPKGEQGSVGPQGPQGIQGPKGENGESPQLYTELGQNTDGALTQKVVTDELNKKEAKSNKVSSIIDTNKTSNDLYPSVGAVTTYLDAILGEIANKLSEV